MRQDAEERRRFDEWRQLNARADELFDAAVRQLSAFLIDCHAPIHEFTIIIRLRLEGAARPGCLLFLTCSRLPTPGSFRSDRWEIRAAAPIAALSSAARVGVTT